MRPKRYSHLLCSVPRNNVEHERDIYEFEKELNRRFRYGARVERNYQSQEYDVFVCPDDPYFDSNKTGYVETMQLTHSGWRVILRSPLGGRLPVPEPAFFYESLETIKAKENTNERIAKKRSFNPLLLLL